MSAQPDLKCSRAEKEDQIIFFKETPVSEVDQTILLVFCFFLCVCVCVSEKEKG